MCSHETVIDAYYVAITIFNHLWRYAVLW